MLGNKDLGILLYCIHAVSAVITGIFLSLFAKKQENKATECNVNIDFRRMVENSQKSSFVSEKTEVHK